MRFKTQLLAGRSQQVTFLTLTVFDAGISGGSTSVNYVVASSDTLNNIASGLASAVNGASSLTTAGITATATQIIVHLSSTSSNLTTYSRGLSSGATETIYLSLNMNGPANNSRWVAVQRQVTF